ncbi:Dynein heavy chain [Phytophthora cinnamomi]|uniref:Dynein heavy chain n=1 Tax=Phytophthora cinnamomi TaxID=4785 RepID=UPI00355AC55D|nr:Dynein heavy chain [Phytophthora cinnamomi]
MDGHLKRHLRGATARRSSLDAAADSGSPRVARSIAAGNALRTRGHARRELQLQQAAEAPQRAAEADMDAIDRASAYAQSRMYADEQQLLELRQRPPVAFVVRNAAPKDEELQAAATAAAAATGKAPPSRGQSWHARVHVPLAHRKLVQPPEIFRDDPPFRPIAPRAPAGPKTARARDKAATAASKAVQKPTKLAPMTTAASEMRDRLSDRAFAQKLREKNKELFDRLVQRFAVLRRASCQEQGGDADSGDNNAPPTSVEFSGVEDAILFFLDAKHRHDVLYFKWKTARVANPGVTAKLSLGFSSAPASTGKYLPYDLVRIDEAPRSGAGDYFMMTSTSLVHHTNNNDNDVSGEVIPLSQWIMESKMFSLLLAGIPLFQKFLVRKVFVGWMKQVRLLKDGEKHLNQNIRNVDETVRALKRFAPPLGSEVSPQYNVMHQFLGKYTSLVQSHGKFAAKVLPNITYQVNTALQKYTLRCQKLLKMYDEFSDMEEEEDMEKNVGIFQEVVCELAAIEKATKLYQEYQRMVGLKIVDIPSLAEATTKWGEVQELVTFTMQWLTTINSMENGIFCEQNWEAHAVKVHSFLPVIRELQSRERAGFAEKLLGNIHQAVIDYLRKLSLVKEIAQPWVKIHHWKEILKLMDILNYVSSIGVLITDGFTVTLGFLRSRELWKYELQIREITQKAHHDAVTEKKLNAMKARLHDATLPIIRIQDSYELDLPRASQLLESFEDDLLTIQSLAQVTASGSLQLQLVQWRDEVRHCEEVLDKWSTVQRSRTKLSLLFSLRDVQQSVTEASFEFQAIDRKWRGMMHAAKGTSSLSICLREVVTIGFLVGAQESYAKLWLQLGAYLDEKRNVLNSLIADELATSDSGERKPNDLQGDPGPDKHIRTIRLYPEAFTLKDIYGEVTGDSTWDDGFFSYFFRQNCVDAASNDSSFDYTLEHSNSAEGTSVSSPQLSRRGSLVIHAADAAALSSNRSLAPASWIVFDGVRDAPTLLEPLRSLIDVSPKDTKRISLPNGDQLECTQESLRIFFEVESLDQWSPACLTRCGLVYMQTDHMVSYTLLIKSWLQQQQPKRKRSSLAHLTKLVEPTSEFAAKLMRTHLPAVLEVFKRYAPPFLECSVTHGVANMLQVLTPLVAEVAKGVVEDDAEWMADAKIIVAYAATMALGMILPSRARQEFHHAAIGIAPHLLEGHPIFTLDSSATLFDVGLRFQDHRAVLFLWSRSLLELSRPATRRSSFAYQSEFPRRTSAVLKARGRIVTSEDTEDAEGDEELIGDTSTITSPLSIIYVPTAFTVSCNAWLTMIGLAKANALVVGESGVGKTLIVENCLRELGQKERVSATALQINPAMAGSDIQRAIENGMTGKLKGANCPGVGKRALVLLLENLNLDTQDSSAQANGPCSAMIRQVIDGKGSFIKSTKEFVEFRDLAVWCSFSLSAIGYPRVPSRLLRHFHMAVLDTTTQLAAQELIEREARRLFLLDEERCAKIQSEIELERASIQRELSKTLPEVQEATEALSQINKYHIVEMKSFTNPPQLVRLAMQAVCVLLDVPPTWSEALRILADIRFLERLRNFNRDSIDPSLIDRVKFYVNHPDFSMENMRRPRAKDEPGATIVVDAGDPNLIRTIETCLAQNPPSMVLIENAAEGNETAVEAVLELIVLLKEKSTCAVYFAAKSLEKAAYWTPKVRLLTV